MGKQDVLQQAKDANVQFIRMWFTDILGTLKSFAITVEELEDALDGGMGFDGSSITGYQDIEESDMIAMPDPSTFKVIPWSPQEEPTARMICDVQTTDGDPYVGDPRHILRRALERANEMGFDRFNVGPELEFFYFKDSSGTEPLDYGGYFDLTTLDAATALRRETVQSLQQLGIRVEHSHQSLFSNGKNSFFDANSEHYLSDEAKAFIAGQLRHARELSIIFAQHVNSYKRLVPGYEAPVYIAWSRRNRSALVRVP